MKKITFLILAFTSFLSFSQQHVAGNLFDGSHANNLVVNGGFEWTDDGTDTGNFLMADDGTNQNYEDPDADGWSGSIVGGANVDPYGGLYTETFYAYDTSFLYQGILLEAGETYTLDVWQYFMSHGVHTDSNEFFVALIDADTPTAGSAHDASNGYDLDGRLIFSEVDGVNVIENTWYNYTKEFTVPAGVTDVFLFFGKPADVDGNGTKVRPTRIDNVQLVKSALLSADDFSLGKFSFYPNPIKNTVNLAAAKNIEKVEFFSLLGQKVLTAPVNALSKQVNIASLQNGVYVMNVTIEGTVGAYKIIKK